MSDKKIDLPRYHPNLSNQYLNKPNPKLAQFPVSETMFDEFELPHSYAGLRERIERSMHMTMEAFPCFDFQYPPVIFFQPPQFSEPYRAFWQRQGVHGNRAALYVHIPFCRSKCTFCYFTVAANRKDDEVEHYLDCLQREIEQVAPHVADRVIESVYIGGGTPTYLKAHQLERLFKLLHRNFNLSRVKEWSIESTPTLIDPVKLVVMKEHGVTRLSMGVQTTQDRILKILNRAFEKKDIEEVVDQAHTAGINNINLDFMYALPNQTLDDWHATLDDAIARQLPGVTLYSLDLHESTHFFRKKDELAIADLATQLRMYDEASAKLQANGYHMINRNIFAREPGAYMHQNRRWQNLPLVALGPGAQSYAPGYAYRNHAELKAYSEATGQGKPAVGKFIRVGEGEEYYREAVSLIRFAKLEKRSLLERYGTTFDEKFSYLTRTLVGMGYMAETDDTVRLTRAGLHRANMISMYYYSDDVKQQIADHLYVQGVPQVQALKLVGLTEETSLS